MDPLDQGERRRGDEHDEDAADLDAVGQGQRGLDDALAPSDVVDEGGAFRMFRRAKLFLADVDPHVLASAQRSGTLVARVGLTDAKGHPVCASITPPGVEWSAA